MLSQRKWIDLATGRFLSRDQFNGMVPRLRLREDIEGLPGEDFMELSEVSWDVFRGGRGPG